MKTARLHCDTMDFSWEGARVEYDETAPVREVGGEAWVDVAFTEAAGAYSQGEVISVPLRYLKET